MSKASFRVSVYLISNWKYFSTDRPENNMETEMKITKYVYSYKQLQNSIK